MSNRTSSRVRLCTGTWYDKRRDLFFTDTSRPDMLQRPLSVALRVGLYCNSTCRLCLSDSGPHRSFEPDSFASVLLALSKFGPIRVVWTGGEPLLYPIGDDLEQSVVLGNFNVISTNLTIMSLTTKLGHAIFWDVSLKGWDEESYRIFAGRDAFKQFDRNLRSLFDADFSVGISIRLDEGWSEYLPRMIEYVSQFPIRKLLLLNTLLIGRLPPGIRPVTRQTYCQLKAFIMSCQLPFTVVLPVIPKLDDDAQSGYIVIEKASESLFLVSGVRCCSVFEIVEEVQRNSAANFRLFTLQKYMKPT